MPVTVAPSGTESPKSVSRSASWYGVSTSTTSAAPVSASEEESASLVLSQYAGGMHVVPPSASGLGRQSEELAQELMVPPAATHGLVQSAGAMQGTLKSARNAVSVPEKPALFAAPAGAGPAD